MKSYSVADRIPKAEVTALGLKWELMRNYCLPRANDGMSYIRAVRTSEFRCPKKGEWYLSGAIPQAWRAPNDLSTAFRIVRLQRFRQEVHIIPF